MRGSLKLSLTVGAVALLAASTVPLLPAAQAAPSATDQLRAHRAALVEQLQSLTGSRSAATAELLSVESAYVDVHTQLVRARTQLAATNARLAQLSRQIADDEATVQSSRTQLAALLRATYQLGSRDGFTATILDANSFNDAYDRIKGAEHVTDQIRQLQDQLSGREKALRDERAEIQRDGARAQGLEGSLTGQDGRMLATVAARDAAVSALSGTARDLAQQIADIDQQLSPNPPPPNTSAEGPCGNHFAFGYCTYYVATRRCIPWFGNAWEWWGNARAYGYAEGHTPERGAVAVFGRGGSSPDGHVAYVEAVGPADGVPDGSFLISEMNYNGWDRVNRRVVSDHAPGLVGFIYGKA